MSDEERKATHTVINVSLKAIFVDSSNDYEIKRVKTMKFKMDDGSFVIHYQDEYTIDEKVFLLERVDREKKTVFYREAR